MSVASEITRINNNIASAYTQVSAKGGTLPATQNSANLATAIASITTGSGAEKEEGNYIPTENIQNPTISFTNTHTTTPAVVIVEETSEQPTDENGVYYFLFVDVEKLTGYHLRYQGTSSQTNMFSYLYVNFQRNATSTGGISKTFIYSTTDTHDTDNKYPRYFIKETGITPYTGFNTTYPNVTFLANHTYKWIAIWK